MDHPVRGADSLVILPAVQRRNAAFDGTYLLFLSSQVMRYSTPLQEPDPHCASCHGTFVEMVSLSPPSNHTRMLVCSYAPYLSFP